MPRGERPYDDKMPYVEIDADSSAVAGSVGGGMGGAASHVQQLLVSAVMQGEDFCAEAFAHHLILEARRYSGCLRY
jgi:hypothetical protein